MKNTVKRTVALTAMVLSCLLMFESPVSATVHTYRMHITSGTITLKKSGATDANISMAPTGTCTSTSTTGTVVTYDDATGAVAVTSMNTTGEFVLGASTFVGDLVSTANTAGTINSTTTPHTISGVTITVAATIYNRSTTPCSKGTRVCGFTTTLAFQGSSTSISRSTTGTLSAPAVNLTTVPPCSPPFSTYIGGTAQVDNMNFHLCSLTDPHTSCS